MSKPKPPAITVIHLLRKPISEGTIAKNVLLWGTGGINVDGTRITFQNGETSPTEMRRATARRTGSVPSAERQLGTNKASEHNKMGRWGRRGDPNAFLAKHPGEELGRWPPNLILQHLPECRVDGVEEVRSGTAGQKSRAWGVQDPALAKWEANGTESYGEGGVETVPKWVCVEGCPCLDLGDARRFFTQLHQEHS